MTVEIIRDALCITVRNQGEYGAFFVRQTRKNDYFCCELTIQSGFGNVGYYWGAMGSPAHQFFDSTDKHYFLNKLFGKGAYVFDSHKTLRELRRMVIRERREGSLDDYEARQIWDLLKDLNYTDRNEFMQEFLDSRDVAGNLILAEWRDPMDVPMLESLSGQAEGLWEHLWPEFVQALKDEAKRNEA